MTADAQASDRELAARLLDGRDEPAFRELYRRHTPPLYATALRLSSGPPDAEDAVHDAWVRAVEALGRFEWRSSLRTWLTSILLHRLREMARQERRTLPLDDDAPLAAAAPPPPLPHGVDPLDLERAVAALPAGYRQVLVLHDVEGFTHEEIAALLEVEPGTSKSQLSRARRHLRRVLGEDDREER